MLNESRKSYRIVMPEGLDQGVFCLGKRQIPVQVIDASAGGFALLCTQSVKVALGAIARFGTSAAWYEVKVIRAESTPDGYLIGVERVADLVDSSEMAGGGWRECMLSGGQTVQRGGIGPAIATVLGFAVCLFLCAFLLSGEPTFGRFLKSLNDLKPQAITGRSLAPSSLGAAAGDASAPQPNPAIGDVVPLAGH